MLAGLTSSAIVVMLSVALVNEAVERRRRRRWSVLAQHVMLELVSNARLIWTGVMGLAGVTPPDGYSPSTFTMPLTSVAAPLSASSASTPA